MAQKSKQKSGERTPRPRRNPDKPKEIFFTMKAYAIPGDGKSLKYTIDFHPPFHPDNNSLEPYHVSPLQEKNLKTFQEIFDHVMKVYKFIVNPTKYGNAEPSGGIRLQQQKNLKQVLELNEGRINHIAFQQNSPAQLLVGTTSMLDGNGDMRPPNFE